MFGSTNTKLWSSGPSYGYIMAEYPEGSQCQITRELDEKVLKAKSTNGNWAFALPEVIGFKIPKEYQEVEWIGTTGTQYIDTGVPARVQIRCEIDAQSTTTNPTDQTLLGGNGSGTQNNVVVIGYNHDSNHKSCYYFIQSAFVDVKNIADMNRHSFVVNFESGNVQFIVDGIVKKQDTSTFTATTSSTTLHLFRRPNGNNSFYGRLYALKIYDYLDSGKMIRNFIPCYRKSDCVAGLWDAVGKSFYTNAGTGTFIAGPAVGDTWTAYCTDGENEAEKKVNISYNGDIKSTVLDYKIPIEYQAIEYLQNSANAYYDTGIIPITTNYTTELKFQVAITDGGYLLGVEGGYRLRKPNGYNQIYYAYIDSETYFAVDGISTVGTDFDLIYNATGGQILLNGVVKATNANIKAKSDRQYSILIGASRYGANIQNYGAWRYKEVIISERDTGDKLAELFPCYRKSDNVVGFWDTVGQKFLTHLGTGTVTAGPDI